MTRESIERVPGYHAALVVGDRTVLNFEPQPGDAPDWLVALEGASVADVAERSEDPSYAALARDELRKYDRSIHKDLDRRQAVLVIHREGVLVQQRREG